MEETIRAYYEEFGFVYPAPLVGNKTDIHAAKGLIETWYRLTTESIFDVNSPVLQELARAQHGFGGIFELLRIFYDRAHEIDYRPNFLSYGQINPAKETLDVSKILFRAPGSERALEIEELIESINRIGTRTSRQWLSNFDIQVLMLLLTPPLRNFSPTERLEANTTVYVLTPNVWPTKKFMPNELDRRLTIDMGQQLVNQQSLIVDSGLSPSSTEARVARASLSASRAISMQGIMDSFAKLSQWQAMHPKMPTPITATAAAATIRRSQWLDKSKRSSDESISPAMRLTFNPHWRCICAILNTDLERENEGIHWIVLAIVRAGAQLERVSYIVFDSLNMWQDSKNIHDELRSIIASLNFVGVATLAEQGGAIPRLMNGYAHTTQQDGTSCALHAMDTVRNIIQYFDTRRDDRSMNWTDWSPHDLIVAARASAQTSAACALERDLYSKALKYLVVFAHATHALHGSSNYDRSGKTAAGAAKHWKSAIERQREEYASLSDTVLLRIVFPSSIAPPGTDNHTLTLPAPVDAASVVQSVIDIWLTRISETARSAAAAVAWRIYDMRTRATIASAASTSIVEYVQQHYAAETKEAMKRDEPFVCYWVVYKDGDEETLKASYRNLTFVWMDAAGNRFTPLTIDDTLEKLTRQSVIADFHALVSSRVRLPDKDFRDLYFYNETRQKLMINATQTTGILERSEENTELARTPLCVLDEFDNGDTIVVMPMLQRPSMPIVGIGEPFQKKSVDDDVADPTMAILEGTEPGSELTVIGEYALHLIKRFDARFSRDKSWPTRLLLDTEYQLLAKSNFLQRPRVVFPEQSIITILLEERIRLSAIRSAEPTSLESTLAAGVDLTNYFHKLDDMHNKEHVTFFIARNSINIDALAAPTTLQAFIVFWKDGELIGNNGDNVLSVRIEQFSYFGSLAVFEGQIRATLQKYFKETTGMSAFEFAYMKKDDKNAYSVKSPITKPFLSIKKKKEINERYGTSNMPLIALGFRPTTDRDQSRLCIILREE